MRIVLMGPPGAGKGTQAAVVAKELNIPHISTGEIFRANVGAGTELGVEAKKYMDKGEYVPDSVTNAMVADRIPRTDSYSTDTPALWSRSASSTSSWSVWELRWTRLLRSRPTLKRSSHGCLTAQSSKAAPTTPKRSFVVGWRSMQSRPNLSLLSTVRKAS